MNNEIKLKLEELMGKEVDLMINDLGISIIYPSTILIDILKYKVLRIEEDCVVFSSNKGEKTLFFDHITSISTEKE